MGVTVRAIARALPAFYILLGAASAQDAQVNVIELPPGVVLPPGLNPAAAPASDAATTAAAAKSPEEKRLAELLKLKFDRSAASILQAQRTIADGKPAENPNEQFRLNVVAGSWAEVGAFLKSLPPADAAKVYDYLLKELDRVPTTGNNPNQQAAGPTPSPTLLLDEIPALADIAPASLGEEQLKLLGALLTRVLAASNFLDPLIAHLETGTEKLGGKDPEKRDLAAQLLLNANRPTEALKFLPPLESGKETASLPLLDRHVRCIFSLGRLEQKNDSIQRSWELNQMILSAADCPADLREKAWRRSGDIVRFLPGAGTAWTKAPFLQDSKRLVNMLDAIAAQIAADRTSRDTSLRIKNLTMQRQIVDALLPAAGKPEQRQPALNLFATNWMEEADYAKRLHQPPRNPNMVQYDDFGNRIYMGNQPYGGQPNNPNQLPAIAITDVLTTAPHNEWIAAVDPSLVPRTLTLLAELHLKLEQDAKALPWLEKLAPLHPKEAQRLANEILRVWASTHDPRRGVPQRSSNVVYYNMYGVMQQQQGIPLTRALQQRNLEELSVLLARLRKLPIPPLDDAAIVTAFTTAHSQAEVFREESIALVLGQPDSIKPETLAELLQTMRQRLATQWRKPAVQQQAKTQRNDAQIDAEVLRGYELLGSLIDKGLARQPDDWRLNLVNAATLFDWAEFQYGKKVDLAIYVDKRERSFTAFQRAADLYAGQISKIEEKDETSLLYQQWLNANLGASDLALLTRQQEPAANQIERIRTAIAALPGGAAERHFNALAKAAGGSDSLPPHLKPVYMRTALSIVGSVQSLLNLQFPEFEIVVVSDGSEDETMERLIEAFALAELPWATRQDLPSAHVRRTFRSLTHPNLIVVDKEAGGKADSLNAGINCARYPLFCGVDADSILERASLQRVVKPFLSDPRMVATGGTIRIANGCEVKGGFLSRVGLPRNLL
ncbi:MAG TPA: glycosyltransferase family 2 protein, partial [Chthoniobacteraceae bacterium]|nr:glycosyltransferase family 2 protein [Chthoniobacteraceae bacterium]